MKIEKIDFNDQEFISLINVYLLQSNPIPRIDGLSSLSAKQIAINQYIEVLSELDLSIAAKNNGEYLFFIFVDKLDDGGLDLEFAFPAINIMEDFVSSRLCFYSLCLYAMEYFGADRMSGTIRRQKKKNPFKIFLKRYIKAITYTENKDKKHDNVYLTKESILNHREKLKAEGNWD